jgi:hypothetical protein
VFIKHTDTFSADVTANTGDYIAYVGTSDAASAWKKNYCLRWNGTQWEQLDPKDSANTDYYMRALGDIDGDEFGSFSVLFAQKIMAMDATIETLQAKILRLYNNNNTRHIELNGQQGRIRSSNFVGSLQERTGFSIEAAEGKIEADLLNTWKLETRPAVMRPIQAMVPGYEGPNWGLQSVLQLGGIRAMFHFWKDANGFKGYATKAVDYDDYANIITIYATSRKAKTMFFMEM